MPETMLTAPLGQVASITMGQSPDSAHVNADERGLPFLQGCAEFAARFPVARVHCFPPLRVARAGSTLISVRAPVGTTNRADHDYCIGRGLAAVLAKPSVADDIFLIHAIEGNLAYLHRRSQGSTFLAVGSADLTTMPVALPALPQQQRIAEIFSTVDEAIEHTEALIAKTQQIKAGLMHDLFTRGVTPDGQLRPPREEAPQLYKESPLGWIPKEWAVDRLSNLGGFANGLNKPKGQFGFGVKFINISDVYANRLDLERLGLINASIPECARYGLTPSDILIDRSSVKLEGVGYPTVFPECDEEVVFCGFIIRFRITTDRLRPRFAVQIMRNDGFRRLVFQVATASANVNVNQQALKQLPMVMPQIEEQEAIEDRIECALNSIEAEEHYARRLRQLKRGLMHDLLTGRVRVATEIRATSAPATVDV